jgi:hypothetical protein
MTAAARITALLARFPTTRYLAVDRADLADLVDTIDALESQATRLTDEPHPYLTPAQRLLAASDEDVIQ